MDGSLVTFNPPAANSLRPRLFVSVVAWSLLVIACAAPMVWPAALVDPRDSVPGIIAGTFVWTWIMVAYERRLVRRGNVAAPNRLRIAAIVLATLQGVAAAASPEILGLLY